MSNETDTKAPKISPSAAPAGSVSIVQHCREFRASYCIGSAWVTSGPKTSFKEALGEIAEWRNKHGFTYPMQVLQTKFTYFAVH